MPGGRPLGWSYQSERTEVGTRRNSMLFQVTHQHTEETCPGVFPERLEQYGRWWNELKNTAGVKVIGGYVSPMDHTFHITIDADDGAVLLRALGPLNAIGTGHTVPVVSLDQSMPMAEAGAFRPR